MTGRLRNLRPFWSGQHVELRAERDAAIEAALKMAEELRLERQRSARLAEAALRQKVVNDRLRARTDKSLAAELENERNVNRRLSDDLAGLRVDLNDLERRYAELERAATPYGVMSP